MTRRIFVTRADGSPAYLNAPPRKRQSHIDLQNAINKRRDEIEAMRPEGEPSILMGALYLVAAAFPLIVLGVILT